MSRLYNMLYVLCTVSLLIQNNINDNL
jgi:hypothetical protein